MLKFLVLISFVAIFQMVVCDPTDCDAPLGKIEITIFPNGGNNSGEAGYKFEVVKEMEPDELLRVMQEAKKKIYEDKVDWAFKLYDRFGRVVANTNEMIANELYFMVPSHHFFFWPGLYVGYTVPLENLFGRNKTVYLETIALSPRLFRLKDFLSEEEVDYIVSTATSRLELSHVIENDGGKLHKARTSTSTWLWKQDNEIVKRIDRRCGELAHVPVELKLEEAMQVVHYDPGQFYHSHNDWFDPKVHTSNPNIQAGVNRMITIFYYLNDVAEGGETIFPFAGPTGYAMEGEFVDMTDCKRGIGVKPTKRDAVMWYSLTARGHIDGEPDVASLHGACPPVSGEKFGANKWIWNKDKVEGIHTYGAWDAKDF